MASDIDSEWQPDDSAAEKGDDDARDEAEDENTGARGSLVDFLTEEVPLNVQVEQYRVLDCCRKKCLAEKSVEVKNLLGSVRSMTNEKHKTSIYTALAMCAAFDPPKPTTQQRERFTYFMPFIGPVCKAAFEALYEISHRTLHLYHKHVREGEIAPKKHGGGDNTNARDLDEELLMKWFVDVAETAGDVLSLHLRLKEIKAGMSRRYHSREDHTFFPSWFTWDFLVQQYIVFLDDNYIDSPRPSTSSFHRISTKRCPIIRIRSPREQVCDKCSIYRSKMDSSPNGIDTDEVFGEHLASAKAMRAEYKLDTAKASKANLVFVMDFAQNLILPHVPDTPSSWYFLSLWSVSMFGVFCANNELHCHYLYTERKGAKGSNEVLSMLHHALYQYSLFDFQLPTEPTHLEQALQSGKSVTVWCDNCGGQNKNSFAVWYLLLLVHSGIIKEANLKFFQRGHTKNTCDRGFGSMKKHICKVACWNMENLVEAVSNAAKSINAVNLDLDNHPFWGFKDFMETRFKKLQGIQKFQMFRMIGSKPGQVESRKSPDSEPVWIDLNTRTGTQAEYTSDPLYQKPTAEMENRALEIKRARRQRLIANTSKKRKRNDVEDNEKEEKVIV